MKQGNNIRLLLILIVVSMLYAFGLERNKKRLISEPEIEFLGENRLFITEEDVNNLLIKNLGSHKKNTKYNLNLKLLEDVLKNNPTIEKAEVFVTTDGQLKAQIKQKTPIARIYDGRTSFYMDYNGTKMPLSDNFSARVPIVFVRFEEQNTADLTKLLRYIYEDEFLRKNIISVEFKDDKNVIMKNRNYNYTINLGKSEQIERKFNNYKVFFQKASQDSVIEQYSNINLKFIKQVVCTKIEN